MHCYTAFGLRIQSERELPIVAQAEGTDPPDVSIKWGAPLPSDWSNSKGGLGDYEYAGDCHRFSWPDLGTIEIVLGAKVTVYETPQVVPGLVEHVLLGPVIADVLLSRGMLPLHASAVQLPFGVIAFVGVSGQGKSTLAAALEQQNCPIHADDIVAVEPNSQSVPYGLGRVKLNPDSATALGHEPSAHPVVYSGIEKRSKRVDGRPILGTQRLLAVYRIKDSTALNFVRVNPKRATFDLYANCFRVEVAQHACGAQELLRRCAEVANVVPLFDLERPRSLSMLPTVARAVREHGSRLVEGT